MCGIVALFERKAASLTESQKRTTSLKQHIKNRGVDAISTCKTEIDTSHLLLIHSRLQIVGDEVDGAQPFCEDNQFQLTFNGEIYNFRDLDAKYLGKGYLSDARVLFELLKKFGVEKVVKIIEGPFAFVFVDLTKKVMTAARDPIGEKPLFFCNNHARCAFSSTAEGCLISLNTKGSINREAVEAYYSLGYVPSTICLFEEVKKVGAGEVWHFNMDTDVLKIAKPKRQKYEFECLTTQAFGKVLSNTILQTSDVNQNLGCFLSGGVDSNLIFERLKDSSNFKAAFTFQYEDISTVDLLDAKQTAKKSGIKLEVVGIDRHMVDRALDTIADRFDEPYADYSAIPTHFIFEAARKKSIKVLFGGDGADELFFGYTRYKKVYKVCGGSGPLFDLMLIVSRLAVNTMPEILRNRFFSRRWQRILQANNFADFYFKSMASFDCYDGFSRWQKLISGEKCVLERMSLLDKEFYLEGDILPKMDRLSLPCGIEGRLPFLNPKIIAFAGQLAQREKVGNFNETKPFLRSLLSMTQGKNVKFRPKTGFGFPIAEYMRSSEFFQEKYKNLLNCRNSSVPLDRKTAQNLFDELVCGNDDLGDRVFLDFMARHKLRDFG